MMATTHLNILTLRVAEMTFLTHTHGAHNVTVEETRDMRAAWEPLKVTDWAGW